MDRILRVALNSLKKIHTKMCIKNKMKIDANIATNSVSLKYTCEYPNCSIFFPSTISKEQSQHRLTEAIFYEFRKTFKHLNIVNIKLICSEIESEKTYILISLKN